MAATEQCEEQYLCVISYICRFCYLPQQQTLETWLCNSSSSAFSTLCEEGARREGGWCSCSCDNSILEVCPNAKASLTTPLDPLALTTIPAVYGVLRLTPPLLDPLLSFLRAPLFHDDNGNARHEIFPQRRAGNTPFHRHRGVDSLVPPARVRNGYNRLIHTAFHYLTRSKSTQQQVFLCQVGYADFTFHTGRRRC